jgi:peptidyl-prolyl cis-trans isomerase D
MLWVRKLLKNWIARVFFVLLVLVFVFWGISNVVTLAGSNTAVAHIGGKPVDIALVEAAYQTQLDHARQSSPTQPDLPTRRQLANQALGDVLRKQALSLEEQSLGLAAPPAAIRQTVYAIPAFQTNGVFDQEKFNQLLQANNKTPDQFLGEVKDDLLGNQLIVPLIAGAAPPAELTNQIFSYVAQERFAEMVTVPFAGQSAPPAPPDAILQRYWRNHQSDFAAPEYREIKIVILSPALLAFHEQVSDADLAAAFARATEGQTAQPLRSVQVITTDTQAAGEKLAAAWQAGADWSKMQALAAKTGGNPVELDKAQQSQFPAAAMGTAVFAATPGAVTGPLPGALGFFVFKVTAVTSSLPDQDALRGQIKQQLQLQKAQADVAQNVDDVQDALAGQTPLDQLPGNLGLVAVEGTLDATGTTPDGTPAPIPGGADLKNAIVKAAFAAQPGAPAQLLNGPGGSYFAFTVDKIIPPSIHPYADVKTQVAAAWTNAAIQRAAEVKAASLLAAANGGQSLDTAASAAGLAVTMSPPVTRNAQPTGISGQMQQILFSLKQGQATMLQTDSGFTVAVLAKITNPQPADDPDDYSQIQTAMTKGLQTDIAQSFVAALMTRNKVTIDQKLLAQLYQ